MRFNIPVATLFSCLMLSIEAAPLMYDADVDVHKAAPDANYVCNEPFMIPAEYVDSSGNVFAMCLSDPRYHRKRIIWYIQDLIGPDYKALGVAVSKGGGEYVGTVAPIQQPGAGSGMHADPVAVRVRLDRNAGVISVNPVKTAGKLVNWIIKPKGFQPGSLRLPDSCGPFLTTLPTPKLLDPLTGADGRDSTVCILHGSNADAFISWGTFKLENDNADPLAIDGGLVEPKFFSVGFVGADRGVSIDICDRSGGEAVRCEMSRLVGNTRKTFVVGNVSNIPKAKEVKDVKEVEKVKDVKEEKVKEFSKVEKVKPKVKRQCKPKAKRKVKAKPKKAEKVKAKECKIDSPPPRDDIIEKIDTIERDIRSILARSQVHEDDSDEEEFREEVTEEFNSCEIEPVKRKIRRERVKPSCPIKKHRVKQCNVQHPLLRPLPNPQVIPQPVRVDNTRLYESKLLRRFQRLNGRLDRLEAEVYRIESAIARRFQNFAQWLRQQKQKIEHRAKDFGGYLDRLKYDVVYTPKKKKTERKFIAAMGKTFRKGTKSAVDIIKKPLDKDLIDPLKNDVSVVNDNLVKPVVNTADNLVNPVVNSVNDNIINPVVNTADNRIINPAVNAVNSVDKNILNPVERSVDNNILNPVVRSVDNNIIRPIDDTLINNARPVKSCATNGPRPPPSRYDRFDYNDDLRQVAADNPLGPVGPVLPPPATETFGEPRQDPSIKAAIDYLS